MKGLFVTHVYDNYGASNSLRFLLEQLEMGPFDLLVHRRLLGQSSLDKAREWCSGKARKIIEGDLPADLCFEGASKDVMYWAIKNMLFRLRRNRILEEMRREHYDFIHLNSLALHPLIDPEFPFILHVREMLCPENRSVIHSANRAKGIVFIDPASRSRFGPSLNVPHIILENPVDMTMLGKAVPDQEILERANGRTVVSLIARHSPVKGTHFVIKTICNNPKVPVFLILAGEWEASYKKECQALAKDSRIFFLGDRTDLASLYLATDVVLRAEENSCVGRTVIEGLFSGCSVLVPWQGSAQALLSDEGQWQDKIFRYIPRNADSFLKALVSLIGFKVAHRSLRSNTKIMRSGFQNLLKTFARFNESGHSRVY